MFLLLMVEYRKVTINNLAVKLLSLSVITVLLYKINLCFNHIVNYVN